jgi:RNA polymerase sigma-70 factor, ECF subfamily
VKGVCDYADQDKDNAYHDYAARASALYALSFIQSYVTRERFPKVDWEKAHVFTLLRHIEREAKECAAQLDLPEQAGYDVLAVISGQAFLGEREVPQMEIISQPSELESSSQPDLSISGQVAELLPDDILIKSIQSGKDEDFSIFHERYYQKLAAYVRSHGYQDDEVEDVVQEAFVTAFHSLKKPHSSDVHNPRVWLLRIANQVMHERAVSAIELDANVLSEVVPDRNVIDLRILEKVLTLPPQYHEILKLLLFGDTPEEIASKLGAPLATVRADLYRGLKLLRQSLESKDIDPPQACT